MIFTGTLPLFGVEPYPLCPLPLMGFGEGEGDD